MGQHSYSRVGWMTSPVAEDLGPALALAVVLVLRPEGALAVALAVAIPTVIAWNVLTLHLPRRVEVDDDGVAFSAYGREHRFDWRDINRIHIRRFVVRDRVLVRIVPSPPLRGRYWLTDSIEGYDELVRALEQRGRRQG